VDISAPDSQEPPDSGFFFPLTCVQLLTPMNRPFFSLQSPALLAILRSLTEGCAGQSRTRRWSERIRQAGRAGPTTRGGMPLRVTSYRWRHWEPVGGARR